MELITNQSRANEAANRWEHQYGKRQDTWPRDTKGIFDKIIALGKTPDPRKVKEIIGNSSWTDCECDECGRGVSAIMEVGQEPDYESSTAHLCIVCLEKALGEISDATTKKEI